MRAAWRKRVAARPVETLATFEPGLDRARRRGRGVAATPSPLWWIRVAAAAWPRLVFTEYPREWLVAERSVPAQLEMDADETYDSRDCDGWHWGRAVYVLAAPVDVKAGASLPVTLSTNSTWPPLHRIERVRVVAEAPAAAKDVRAKRLRAREAPPVLFPMLTARLEAARARDALKTRFAREPDVSRRAFAQSVVDDLRRLARSPDLDVDALAVQDLLVNMPYMLPRFALPGDAWASSETTTLCAVNGNAFER